MAYSPVSSGDKISVAWGNYVEDALAGAPANFVVFYDTTDLKYKARKKDGSVPYKSTNVTSIISDVLTSGLTAGRTYKEKVVLDGDFTVTTITIPSYTILEINGKLKLADSTDDNLLITASAATDIDVIGGILDGNKANQTSSTLNGIKLVGATRTSISNVTIKDVKGCGVYIDEDCKPVRVSNFVIKGCTDSGVYIYGEGGETYDKHVILVGELTENQYGVQTRGAWGCIFNSLSVHNNTADGFKIKSANMSVISNCTIYENTNSGIVFWNHSEGVIIGNSIGRNTDYGIEVRGYCYVGQISGNTVTGNLKHGIYLWNEPFGFDIVNNCVGDNNLDGTGNHDNIHLEDKCCDNYIAYNDIYDASADYAKYGVNILGGEHGNSERNTVVHNFFKNQVTGPINDEGVNTFLSNVIVSFVDGTACEDSGWDIDVVGEYARAFAFLPGDVTKIVRIKIYARSMVTEADAMRLEININGGGDNEAYNTEAIAVADKASTSTNFATDDIIYWTLTSSDDADIGDLARGDSLEIKVLGEDAGGDDCTTDARFRTVEIQYV